MNVLLMSSSRSADSGFLELSADDIRDTLKGIKRALFLPYAILGNERNDRIEMVAQRFKELGCEIANIESLPDPAKAVADADAILVSGGNTFHLLKSVYDNALVGPLRQRVKEGAAYIGWSAGSNLAGRTIRTTNDMPIVYPPTFDALGLVSFHLNPHFTDAMPPGLMGETREQRIREFLDVNPNERVVGLPEGDALRIVDGRMTLNGPHDAWLFEAGKPRLRLEAGRDLSHLL